MAGSNDEEMIRDAVVDKLRKLLPNARIIHELNVAGQGSNRIDVAAVTPDRIVAVEIKSEKDSLKRAEDQLNAFRCCHDVIIAPHDKFREAKFVSWRRSDLPRAVVVQPEVFRLADRVWYYPEPDQTIRDESRGDSERWSLPRPSMVQPAPRRILGMLWRDELFRIATVEQLPVNRTATIKVLIDRIAYDLSGHDIAKHCCASLRAREFARADTPIKFGSHL